MERESDPSVASPWWVAWRTRHLVGTMLGAGVVLVGLTLVAMQADPNAVDLGVTRWIQQVNNPVFQGLMYWVSWLGYSPQNLIMPVVLASPFAIRRLSIEAVWVLGSQAASLVVLVLKALVHRARPSADLVGVPTPLTDPSFPSGHVVQYTTLFGVTFFLVYVLAPQSRLRTVALFLLPIPIVVVRLSRL